MNLVSHKKQFVFACSDVGPAKYLAELVPCIGGTAFYLASNKCNPIFGSIGAIPFDFNSQEQDISLVITGTSLSVGDCCIDKTMLKWSRKNGIPCVSVVDHWTWYRKRFEVGNHLILPDFIIVNDDTARQDAISEGLPEAIVKSLGNPYLERLSQLNEPSLSAVTARRQYGLPLDKRIVLFVSEELKSSFPSGTSDYLGYDEYLVLNSLISQMSENDHLVIKLHPEESLDKYDSWKNNISTSVSVLTESCISDISALADIIVGMDSMLLLELSVFRRDIISYRPNASKTFVGDRLGLTVPVRSESELKFFLLCPQVAQRRLGDIFLDSKQRILSFLHKIQK
jgi:hypothetical protein